MASIRGARLEEAELLAEIGLRAWEQAMIPVGETRQMLDSARRAFRNFTHSSWITIFVVETGGATAGWAAREGLDELITDFWIDPASEGRGLGTLLLEAIEIEMREQGHATARVETHARNEKAIAFFRARGYSIHWFSAAYNPRFDRDVETVGLVKQLAELTESGYGQEF
ncbi:GNAT family N-acetyltransferase [Rhizobium halophytocola]|uniref:Ribosomal-protein-alanine N-acetyltransferase n=1 Tax=Rhizobium halophytocola TaxID=735519 RepID=A0ABS4DY03_9HYPH|nr:GNAT family N-acetyltransferase [Rhizobium halophytocola]MBP1850571.1 ribosomal-protein-alanine N-acetyltransferase [Rhizobium halophytocola]